MVLQYLPMIATGLQALSALSAAKDVAKGYQPTQAEIAQLQSIANADRLTKAYLNPDDVITKNITAAEDRDINRITQEGLSNLLAANRKAQLMGRQTYFNPERTDEAISQYLTRAADVRASTARSNALQRILQSVQNYSGNASRYGSMIPNQQAAQAQNRSRASTLFGMGADALGSGGSLSNIFAMLGNRGGGNVADLGTAMPWLQGAA